MYSKNKSKGFTLIEAILAVFILLIGIIGVSQLFPFSISLGKSSEMTTQAAQFAQAKIEEIISRSYSEIRCTASLPPCEEVENEIPENTSFKRTSRIKFADPFNNLQEPTPVDTDTGIKKIEIIVSWKSSLFISGQSISIVNLFSER